MVLNSAEEERILDRTLAVFSSRMKGWAALGSLLTAAWAVAAVWAALSFFRVETTRDWILYASIFLMSALGVSLLKIWFWMEMNHHAQIREIKRLELQVARIAEKLG